MKGTIPTRVGDVLILRSDKAGNTHAVGAISEDGQQNFRNRMDLKLTRGREKAEAAAKARAVTGGKIYFRDNDTGEWDEIPN